jgi:hypothetical protein
MKVLLVLELGADTEAEMQRRLDAFREAVQPRLNYGLTIYRASHADIRESGMLAVVRGLGPCPDAFIAPWNP